LSNYNIDLLTVTFVELIWISTRAIKSTAERSVWQGFLPMFPSLLTCACPSLSFHHFSKYCLKQCLPFAFRFSLSKTQSTGWPSEISFSFLSSPALQAEMDSASWIMNRYVLYEAWDVFYQFYCIKWFWKQRYQCVCG